jgi:peptidoglycan/LPS O-acetylase OafA/YrhL
VLGPLHYLTEISWLGERRFFMRGRWDWVAIAGVAVLSLLGSPFVLGPYHVRALAPYSSQLIFVAFGLGLVFALVESRLERTLGRWS